MLTLTREQKQELIDDVIRQLKIDVDNGDVEAIQELLESVLKGTDPMVLVSYLCYEEGLWSKYYDADLDDSDTDN